MSYSHWVEAQSKTRSRNSNRFARERGQKFMLAINKFDMANKRKKKGRGKHGR
jgi:hypothetical protein